MGIIKIKILKWEGRTIDLFSIIAEEKIKKAYKDGEFENLPGYGKPLPKDDLAAVPESMHIAYRILKNAGYTPEENDLKNEIKLIEDLIKLCEDPQEIKELQKKVNEKLLHYNRILSKRKTNTNSTVFKSYENKIQNKLL